MRTANGEGVATPGDVVRIARQSGRVVLGLEPVRFEDALAGLMRHIRRIISVPFSDYVAGCHGAAAVEVAKGLVRRAVQLMRDAFTSVSEGCADAVTVGGDLAWRERVEMVIDEERLDRLVGMIVLNQHSRHSVSPWATYLEWLRAHGGEDDARRLVAVGLKHAGGGTWATRALAQCGQVQGCAVYVVGTTCCNHSCDPNADACGASHRMELTARRDIAAGEEVTCSYLGDDGIQWPLERRRAALQKNYMFLCTCPKCAREEAEQRRYVQRMYGAGVRRSFAPGSAYPSRRLYAVPAPHPRADYPARLWGCTG